MKQVPLSNGMLAIIDDVDVEAVAGRRWHALKAPNGRRYAWSRGRAGEPGTIYMHRLLMGLIGPQIDHRDGNGLNNRRANLRHATNSLNAANTRVHHNCVARLKGVRANHNGKAYRAQFNKKSLGAFATREAAARAYDAAAVSQFGEFACVNFPSDYPHLNLRCARRLEVA